MLYELTNPVDREFILRHISQEQMMEHYLGIPVQFSQKVRSPLRRDNHPTCGFKYARNGRLYFKDFSGHFFGDVFDIVQHVFGLNYDQALRKVAGDFDLISAPDFKSLKPKDIDKIEQAIKEETKLTISTREPHKVDKDFWGGMGITYHNLQYFDTHLVQTLWLGDNIIYNFSPSDPAYAYRFAQGEFKVYFPYRSRDGQKTRFISNTTRVQGYNQLPDSADLLILTKSMKDVIVIRRLGLYSCAMQAESVLPPKELIEELNGRFTHIYSLYDFDYAGVCMANQIKRLYGIHPIFLTNGRFGSANFQAKDPAEFVTNHSIERAQKIIEQARKKHNV